MTQAKCRVIALAPGRDVVSLQQIAQTLSGQTGGDPQRLLQQLQGSGVVVAEVACSADADPVATAVTSAGADYRVVDEAGRVLRQGNAPKPEAFGATVMGGFQAPAAASSVRELGSIDEADLLTLDEAQAEEPKGAATVVQPAHANDFIDLENEPSGQAGQGMAPDPVAQAMSASKLEPGPRDSLDGLDAASLMLLDGTTEQKAPPPPPLEAVVAPTARPPSVGADDEAFAPPAPDPSFLPESATESLELDTAYSEQALTGPISPETLARVDAATEPAGAVPDVPPPPPVPAAAEEPAVQPEPRSTGRRDWFQPAVPRAGRSARRRAEFLLLDGRLRATARLRVALGFAAALLLGSLLPMCHAGSVMNSRVHTLRVELSTARARGTVRRASGFQSVEEIEKRISGVKTRSGIVTFLIWLSSTGLLLFLWFRFT